MPVLVLFSSTSAAATPRGQGDYLTTGDELLGGCLSKSPKLLDSSKSRRVVFLGGKDVNNMGEFAGDSDCFIPLTCPTWP